MPSAYFDTNVYSEINKGSAGLVHPDEGSALRAALASGEISASLSIVDVEELLGGWDSDHRAAAVGRLRFARDIVGFDGLLKQPADLLTEAIQAYAVGEPQPPPTLPRHDRRYLAACLAKVAGGSREFDRVMSQIIADVKGQKEHFRVAMGQAGAQTLAELTQRYDRRVLRQVPFEEFWRIGAEEWAEDFARSFGLAELCGERGLDGLLEVRTVRLCVGASMSLVYSQVVEGCAPDLGDGYDLWHAILASVADVFVTFDQRFACNLERIPAVNGFRVVRSVAELLEPQPRAAATFGVGG